ncbi:MBL fold metallo-hydrolase [Leucobacter sp. USHLN153]|uniref:MBL fold metallo-hydrolase n=1 Tax=Leucobacter sp. USHLN153 TaxID=3081268 RepID=UPI003019E740
MGETDLAPPPDGVVLVAEGVVMITRANVNCYLVRTGEGIVLVDAGLPGMRGQLRQAFAMLEATPADLLAVELTHGHFDHVGLCRSLQDLGVPIIVHPADAPLVRHPYRYAHESPRLKYPFRYPAALPGLLRMTGAGALNVRGTTSHSRTVGNGATGEETGLRPILTPGHTFGHCALTYGDGRALFTGDALVTYDPYTGKTGPRTVARAATADARLGLDSVRRIAGTGAELLLPGHGAPFRGTAERAAELALAAGID